MADTLGSQASDAANKAANELESAAKAVGDEAKKAAGDVADAAKGVAEDAKKAVEGAVDPAKPAGPPPAKPAGPPPVKASGPPPVKPAGPPPVKAGGPPPVKPAAAGATAATVAAKPAGAAAKKEEEPVAAPPKGVSRREFLNYVWGASMALFLAQFAGITFFFAMPRFRAGEFGGKIDVRAEEFPALNAAPVSNNPGKFWLVNTDAGIATLYKICTHLGCIYPWSDAANIFACPCHGSQFELNGDWIAGPAPRNLDRFAFEVLDASGNVLADVMDGKPIPMPAGAAIVRVNTGVKVLGDSHF